MIKPLNRNRNRVAPGRKPAAAKRQRSEFSQCECGCGTKIPKQDKNGKVRRFVLGHNHHLRRIQDEFTDLPVSRERKRQLRALKQGLCCIAGCEEPLATRVHCLKHAIERREKSRKDRRITRRWKNARTYQLEEALKKGKGKSKRK